MSAKRSLLAATALLLCLTMTAAGRSRGHKKKKEKEQPVAPFPKNPNMKTIREWIKTQNRGPVQVAADGPMMRNVRWMQCLPEACDAYPWGLDFMGREVEEQVWLEFFRNLTTDLFKNPQEKKKLPRQRKQGEEQQQAIKNRILHVIGAPSGKDKALRGYRISNRKGAQYALAYYLLSPREQTLKVKCVVEQAKKARHKVEVFTAFKPGSGKTPRKVTKVKLLPGVNCILVHITLGSSDPCFFSLKLKGGDLYYPLHFTNPQAPVQYNDYNEKLNPGKKERQQQRQQQGKKRKTGK